MRHATDVRSRQSPQYAFDTLHALPCGCVAAVYKARMFEVEVLSLEARGPHCLYAQHQAGRVLGMADADSHQLSR
jgi:hypothetical protein